MKTIHDAALLARLLESGGILAHFSARPEGFRLVRYESNELITSPLRPLQSLLFVVRGSFRIYGLREDGSDIAVSIAGPGTMLGDMEFVRPDFQCFYTEALGEVLCAALPFEHNREALERDCVFLNYLLQCVSAKVQLFALIGNSAQPVEEKLLTYLREIQADHTLSSVNLGIHQFQCSRRQLQRVLRKLCDEGRLVRLGKGRYRLNEDPRS